MFLNDLCEFATCINTSTSLQGSFDVAFFITNRVFETPFIGSVLESQLLLWGFSTLEHNDVLDTQRLKVTKAANAQDSWQPH